MKKKRGVSTKTFVIILALVLVFGAGVGGTLAWLTDATASVTNTFTVGDINITLAETTSDYKMVPGNEIAKDPKVTVEGGSEACWLFVKVDETENFDDFMTCAIADGWTALTGTPGVYYRQVAASDEDQTFHVLKDDEVLVKESVTKAELNALTSATLPKLTFTAYAVQKDSIADVQTAWSKVPST